MAQGDRVVNSDVEEYLDYYCQLSHAPGFAILLKGQWGAGKTWFINRYSEKLKKRSQQCLYISLYGMSTLSEIDDKFFELLHPILSSKGMAITGIIVKGLLKLGLRIDLDGDKKEDGIWNIQIPEINLPKHLENINESILIFDDLERCNIELGNLLGYINYFVEHQGLKVVIVANEDELIKKDKNYQIIKEKLIGRTFGIFPDFERALENFRAQTGDTNVRSFLSENVQVIKDLYDKAEYENLRNLKVIVLDFERIFKAMPEKVRSKPEILKYVLKLLIAFSIEIKRGRMLPEDINKLPEEYTTALSKLVPSRQTASSVTQDKDEEPTSLHKIINTYSALDLDEPFPSSVWWQIFFERGIIDSQELEQSILNSKYFQDENTPDWVKLWHFSGLSDEAFDNLIMKIEGEYNSRNFLEIGIVKHIFGLFLRFSDAGIYAKSKQEILKESKNYIDALKNSNQLEPSPQFLPLSRTIGHRFGIYLSLGFQGKEFEEFQEFSNYINEIQELERIDKAPQDVLDAIQNDVGKFCRMICLDASPRQDVSEPKYHETPILKDVDPASFLEKILQLNNEDRQYVFWAIQSRYKYENLNEKLIEELEWLKSIQGLLLEEANCKKGKLSGFLLELLNTNYLREVIEKLETKKGGATN